MADPTTQEALLSALAEQRGSLIALLERFDEEQWRAARRADGWTAHDIAMHIADSTYGLALMALGEVQPSLPLGDTGWIDVGDYNEQRRLKNAAMPRQKVMSRIEGAFDNARRAIEVVGGDLDAPGPYGPVHTRRMWLGRIVEHVREHRAELEALLQE